MKFDKLYELFCEYYQDDGSNDEIMKSRIEKAFLMYAQNQGQKLHIDSVVNAKRTCPECGSKKIIMFTSDLDICQKCNHQM